MWNIDDFYVMISNFVKVHCILAQFIFSTFPLIWKFVFIPFFAPPEFMPNLFFSVSFDEDYAEPGVENIPCDTFCKVIFQNFVTFHLCSLPILPNYYLGNWKLSGGCSKKTKIHCGHGIVFMGLLTGAGAK